MSVQCLGGGGEPGSRRRGSWFYCISRPSPGSGGGNRQGLAASTGGGPSALWAGLPGAGIIVVLLAGGISASQAVWSERVEEAGGDGLSSLVALSIALPTGGGHKFSGGGAELLGGSFGVRYSDR